MEIVDLKISRSDNRIAKDLCPRNLARTAPDFQILCRSTIPLHDPEWTAPDFQIFRSSDLRFPAHRSDLQFPAPLCSDLRSLSTILTGPPPNSRSLDLQDLQCPPPFRSTISSPPFRSTMSSPPLFRSTIPVHDPGWTAPEFQIFRSSDLRFPAHRSDLQFPAPLCSDLRSLSTILTGPPPNSRSLDLQIYDFQPTVQIYPCPRA